MFHPNAQMIDALVASKHYKPLIIEDSVIDLSSRLAGWRKTLFGLSDVKVVQRR